MNTVTMEKGSETVPFGTLTRGAIFRFENSPTFCMKTEGPGAQQGNYYIALTDGLCYTTSGNAPVQPVKAGARIMIDV